MSDWQLIPINYKGAWLSLLAGLLATGYFAYSAKSDIDLGTKREFASRCETIQFKIEGRLQTHKQVLLGGAALFDASDSVTRNEWRAYAERVEIDQHFNGIQGLGFSLLIPQNRLAQHISEIRRQGFPKYTVSPAGKRGVYSSIIYLEPFKDRNLRAFGYDMYSEPVRRAAMEQARDENNVSLSGKVTLVQETGKDVQAGTLMYAPVYLKNMPTGTAEQRSAALYGWVYSPFRMADMLHGVLRGWDNPQHNYLSLRVYDGLYTSENNLLFSSDGKAASSPPTLFALERHLDFNGRIWTLHFDLLEGKASGIDYSKAWIILAGGMGLSILSFFLMLSYLNTRRNAARIADELTVESRQASRYARSLIEASLDPLVTISAEGKITDVNAATEKATGRRRAELIGTDFSDYFTEPGKAREGYLQVFARGFVTDYPLAIRHIDGHVTDVLYNASVYRSEAGEVAGVFAAARDITERKQIEDIVREKEERLALATLHNGIGIWDWNLQTQEMIWDDSMYSLYRIRREDFSGTEEAWRASLHPDDLERGDREVEAAISGEKPFDTEFRVIWPSGEIRHIKAVAKVFRDDHGNPLRMLGTNVDITEHKKTEEAVKESEKKFRAMTDTSPLAIYMSSGIEQKAEYINPTFTKLFGYTLDEVPSVSQWWPLAYPDEKYRNQVAEEWQRKVEQAIKTNSEIEPMEVVVNCKDGSKKNILWGYISTGVQNWAFGLDLTERKKAEQALLALKNELELRVVERTAQLEAEINRRAAAQTALQESEERFRAITTHNPDHLLMQNRDLRYTFVMNPQLGLTEKDMLGKTDYDFLSPEDAEKITSLKKKVLSSATPEHVETSLIAKNGELEYFDGTYIPKLDAKGKVDGLIGYFRNVTERKKNEDQIKHLNNELRQRAQELEAANKELEAFSYSVSHDLRTPLRAIDGFSNILLTEYAASLDEEGKRLLNVVRDNTVKLAQLIDDILKFSRTGRAELSFSEIDMQALAREVYQELLPDASGYELEIDIGPIPRTMGDRAMMHQVFVNLISNAIKFSRFKTPARIKVGAYVEENETVYFVQDNGAGFNMNYVDKLFGVFQRLHTENEFEGTGIGLAIVKRIVSRHGGRVWAEGKVGEGATIYFALPNRPAEGQSHA